MDLKEIGKPDFNVGLSQYFVHKLIISTVLDGRAFFLYYSILNQKHTQSKFPKNMSWTNINQA